MGRRASELLWAVGTGLCGLLAAGEARADPEVPGERITVFRVGADLGISRIAGESWWQLNATGILRVGPVRVDFAAPLRFGMGDFRFREEDYAQGRDALRVLRCARIDLGDYRHPEDRHDPNCDAYESSEGLHERVYGSVRLSPLRDVSLGHQTLVTGFNNSLDPNTPQIGAQAEGILRDFGQFQMFLDDVSAPRLVAGNVSIRPLQLLGENWDETPDDLRITAGVVSDLAAPLRVHGAFGQPVRNGEGAVQMATTRLTALTADVHYLYLWYSCVEAGSSACEATRGVGLFGFADYNRFVEVDDGDGLHAGLRFRYLLRQRFRRYNGQALEGNGVMLPTWEVDAGGEYRNVGNRYLPGYFDANYGVQSQSFALNRQARDDLGVDALTTTKLEYMLSQPGGRQSGFQAYFRVYFPVPTAAGEPPTRMPLTLWAEDSAGPLRTSVGASVGPFRLDQVALSAQIVRRNFDGWGNLFTLDGTQIRAVGSIYLSSQASRRQSDSFLNNLQVNLAYNRRFVRDDGGDVRSTDDFLVTLGSTVGVN
ncbi:MAG: hypothetical protein JWM10_955 [Myxococcaceae bacterium]|nr:hypothetical protein [Myxococcaceae bacterium]